jgi:hypothetical protein
MDIAGSKDIRGVVGSMEMCRLQVLEMAGSIEMRCREVSLGREEVMIAVIGLKMVMYNINQFTGQKSFTSYT